GNQSPDQLAFGLEPSDYAPAPVTSTPERNDTHTPLPEPFARWFASRGWAPRAHQLELLAKARAGRSVLLIAPTGAGKTLAGFLPSLVELNAIYPRSRWTPSPLVGEGWGGGWGDDAPEVSQRATPTPNPSPQGGRERTVLAA